MDLLVARRWKILTEFFFLLKKGLHMPLLTYILTKAAEEPFKYLTGTLTKGSEFRSGEVFKQRLLTYTEPVSTTLNYAERFVSVLYYTFGPSTIGMSERNLPERLDAGEPIRGL
ncbi:hypothetical protein J6590_054635, partial [Homalodisca vitripennis]